MKKHPIRVVHVVGAMNRGGTETFLMNLYRKIDREKVQFDFISYSTEEAHYDREIEELGGKVIRLQNARSLRLLQLALKENGPYVAVHSHTLFHSGIAVLAARLAGIRIRISHAHTTADKNGALRSIYTRFMRTIIKQFSTDFLFCSRAAGEFLFGKNQLEEANASYFPNLIDYKAFLPYPAAAVNRFKMEEGLGKSLVLGHIGTFKEVKNHAFLLEILRSIMKRDPTVKLILAGDGELKEHMQKEALHEGLAENIRFLGVREDIATILHSMDVFVFPSLYEGLGLVLLEAQACGTSCVVSENIQPEADLDLGLVTKLQLSEGADRWAEKILEISGTTKKNLHLIEEGFERNGFSGDSAIGRLMQIYQLGGGDAYEENVNRFL